MSRKSSLICLLIRLWAQVLPRRRLQLSALGGLMLVGTMAELVSLGLALPFLGVLTAPDRVFGHSLTRPLISLLGLTAPRQLLLPLTVLFCGAAIGAGGIRLALLWGQTRLGNAIGNDLGSAAFRRTLYQPYAMHVGRNSSEVISALLTKINTIVYFIIIPLLSVITSILIVSTVVMFLILVNPQVTAMAIFGFGCLYALIAYTMRSKLVVDGQRVTVEQNRVAKVVQEALGGIREVLIDGLQETYSRIYRQADGQLRRGLSNIAIIGGAPRPLIEALGLVLIGLLAYSLTTRSEGMSSAIPILGALALAAQRLLPLVQQGYAGWTSMLGGQTSLGDVLLLLEQPLPEFASQPLPAPMPFRHQIALTGLRFRYGEHGPWILKDIDLEIPCGSQIGFIGSTGSGKSTLMDVVMGLLSPTSGTIKIDGVEIDQVKQRAWQANIAHVPQTIFLADASIAENIAFGFSGESIDRDRVKEAARRAQISDTIESWVKGYDTLIGERGIRLSGGQRQRIGIARALYKNAAVLVLDEATSALDSGTERLVMESISATSSDLTVLIVAHRLTTLQACDQVVELTAGKIRRIGSYEDMVVLASQGIDNLHP